jgi:hypothetical protein
MEKHGVTTKQLIDFGKPEPTLPLLVREIGMQFIPGLRPSSKLLAATQSLSGVYMAQLRRNRWNPYARKMAVSPAFKELRVALWTMAA